MDNLLPAVLVVPLVLLVPPLLEELGWRGFALGHLLQGASPVVAALALGAFWA